MNYSEQEIESLESSMELWLLGNREDAIKNFGEDIVAAITEELDYE